MNHSSPRLSYFVLVGRVMVPEKVLVMLVVESTEAEEQGEEMASRVWGTVPGVALCTDTRPGPVIVTDFRDISPLTRIISLIFL